MNFKLIIIILLLLVIVLGIGALAVLEPPITQIETAKDISYDRAAPAAQP